MHVAFDLDGVLLDSERDLDWLDRALGAALEELGLDPDDAAMAGLYPPTVERIHAVAGELGISPERLWRVRNAHYVRAKLAAIDSGEIEPFDDVDALYELTPRHDLHIISNSPGRVVRAFVDTAGYDDLFDVRLGREEGLDDLAHLKPHPHLYHQLVDRLDGDRPSWYVGDSSTDRAFAEATGMRFLHLNRDGGELSTLRSLPARLD